MKVDYQHYKPLSTSSTLSKRTKVGRVEIFWGKTDENSEAVDEW
jgi:hypothetical protein